jgi:preprotein translocase subunit SecG
MSTFLIAIHVIVCIALIMIVLLQTGKGADIGATFGGGSSQTLFGSSGASTFLGKATTVAAVIFMITSLALAYRTSYGTEESIMTKSPPPVEKKASPAEVPETAPTSDATAPENASDSEKQ